MISEVTGPSNKGMKLSKPDYLVGRWPIRIGIIESGFAAYAQCSADAFLQKLSSLTDTDAAPRI
jgi:hypothetical protein